MLVLTRLKDSADRRLAQEVFNAMRDRLGRRSESITVSADGGQITIQGVVRSFYEKQLTLSAVKRVEGVCQLNDEVQVLTDN